MMAEVGPTGGRMRGGSIDLDAKAVGIMTGSFCTTGTWGRSASAACSFAALATMPALERGFRFLSRLSSSLRCKPCMLGYSHYLCSPVSSTDSSTVHQMPLPDSHISLFFFLKTEESDS
jgi:hypothetical protein